MRVDSTRGSVVVVLLVAVLAVVAGCSAPAAEGQTAPGTTGPAADAGSTTPTTPPRGPGTESAAGAATGANYTALYRETIDSVVMVRVRGTFGTAQGSGFVYDAHHVVTNHHVVSDASSAMVRFRDGEWRDAEVVGTDPYTDLAVLRVDAVPEYATPLPVSHRDPAVGRPVAALGSPFGLEGTMTHGIVSGVNRSMRAGDGFAIPDAIQTDAPINPGNSGGPLVDARGRVVGVNRAKEGDNVGFAISAAVVRRVVPALVANGSYPHTYVGVRTVTVTPEVADANGLDEARGLLVVDVVDGTPADGVLMPATDETAGGVPTDGDVIVGVGGHPIDAHQQLARYLLLHTRPGDAVDVTVVRDGERVTRSLTLDRRPAPT
ncbi:MAG: S1C family serine protease [Halobacteriaceae archaeon]